MFETLTVNLGERSYPIELGADLRTAIRAEVEKLQGQGRTVAALTDAHLAGIQRDWLEAALPGVPRLVVAAGEEAKSLRHLGQVWDFLAAQKLGRDGVLVVVGGGVIGDLGGFAAASYLRGVDFYQVPTTLLAMVDSSVGGKTGINLTAGKNLAGAFHQPKRVFVAADFLRTLPAREFAAGAAEVIKYGLLGEVELFGQLEQAPMRQTGDDRLPAVVRRCCAIKARIVADDERETAPEGGRALLNLGHTFGHAIEQVAGYGVYLHGEAVGIGLVAAAELSQRLGNITERDAARVAATVAAHGLPVRLRGSLPLAGLMEAVLRDKKVRHGRPRFVVLRRLGEAATDDHVASGLAEDCFRSVGAD